jgi:hypothetical protein
MKKFAIIICGIVLTCAAGLVLWIGYGGAEEQDPCVKTQEPYDEEPNVIGEDGTLYLGDWAELIDFKVPCFVGQGKSPFASDGSPINSLIVGNAWGKVTGNAAGAAWADAYYDGETGDCDSGEYAGYIDNDYPFYMIVEPVIATDTTGSDEAYFRFCLTDIREYTTTDCTGSYTSLSSSCSIVNTHDNDMGATPGNGITTWKQCEFDSNGSCLYPNRGISYPTLTGYRSYHYKIDAVVCEISTVPCPAENRIAVGDDTGCFYVYWNEDV